MSKLKECPYCGEEILAKAIKCKHCHSMLDESKPGVVAEEKTSPPVTPGPPARPQVAPPPAERTVPAADPPSLPAKPAPAERAVPPPPPLLGRVEPPAGPAAPPVPPRAATGAMPPPPPVGAGRTTSLPPPPPGGSAYQQVAPTGGTTGHFSGMTETASPGVITASGVHSTARNYPKAGLGRRVIAYIIDMIISSVGLLVTAPIAFIPLYTYMGSGGLVGPDGFQWVLMAVGLLVGFGWALFYSLLRDGFGRGRSLGKRAAGLMVVRFSDNLPCTKKDSLLRNVVAIGLWIVLGWIPVLGYFAGFAELLIAIFDAKGMRLGDRLAKTQVIEAEAYQA